MGDPAKETVLVTGGAGYVGSALVPCLLSVGYQVRTLDIYLYGEHGLGSVADHPGLSRIRGDLRNREVVRSAVSGCDSVIHLACISNDPSFDLDPELGRSVNFDAFEPLLQEARAAGTKRFIYASSSSVYGIKEQENVDEEASLEPLTEYSRYKAMCEQVLAGYQSTEFTTVTVRPATVCGYAPRQRLDVIVNILTNHAVNTGVIRVFGGPQKRPNIHVRDMVAAYLRLLQAPSSRVAGRTYNVGLGNFTVSELAEKVRAVVGPDRVRLSVEPTDDPRSYHISSERIARELDFHCHHSIEDAVRDLVAAFADGRLPNPMTDSRYYNVRAMKTLRIA